VFLFEDLPASDRRADAVYLDEVASCDIYIGLFGNEYGFENESGISPTEQEFNHAKNQGKPRLIYVKGGNREK
jgi:ATP-dependent DNA helicase RecG